MAEKTIKSRIVHKHDSEANWNRATNFVPKQGELIIYDTDTNHSYARVKIGDVTTNVSSLPFFDIDVDSTTLNSMIEEVLV